MAGDGSHDLPRENDESQGQHGTEYEEHDVVEQVSSMSLAPKAEMKTPVTTRFVAPEDLGGATPKASLLSPSGSPSPRKSLATSSLNATPKSSRLNLVAEGTPTAATLLDINTPTLKAPSTPSISRSDLAGKQDTPKRRADESSRLVIKADLNSIQNSSTAISKPLDLDPSLPSAQKVELNESAVKSDDKKKAAALNKILHTKPAVKLNHAALLRIQSFQQQKEQQKSLNSGHSNDMKPNFVTSLTPKIDRGGVKITSKPLAPLNKAVPSKEAKPVAVKKLLPRKIDTSQKSVKPGSYVPHKGTYLLYPYNSSFWHVTCF